MEFSYIKPGNKLILVDLNREFLHGWGFVTFNRDFVTSGLFIRRLSARIAASTINYERSE
jgi:hypothetical protein